jgi:hypothetical protein
VAAARRSSLTLRMSGASIARALVQYQQLKKRLDGQHHHDQRGAVLCKQIASTRFHQELAIAVSGIVVSSPLIEPSQSSFTSFGRHASVAGPRIGHAEALRIAGALTKK